MKRSTVVLAGAAVVVALAAGGIVATGGIGAAETPADGLEVGDLYITEIDEHTFEVAAVATASSGLLACDRVVVTDTDRRGDEFIMEVRRPVFAVGCNDDQLARVVRVKVTESRLAGAETFAVTQDGARLAVEVVPPPDS